MLVKEINKKTEDLLDLEPNVIDNENYNNDLKFNLEDKKREMMTNKMNTKLYACY